jgi:uncharacterized protein
MRVNIDEIKEAGLGRHWDVSREDVDGVVRGDRAGWRARGGASLDVRLEKLEQRIFLNGAARLALESECGRCLAPVATDLPVEFELTLVPAEEAVDETLPAEDQAHRPVAGSFDPEAAEEDVYTGKVIDIDAIFREQVLLSLPSYPVCRETCQGLCSVCGANLNETACGCDRKVPDPRWAGLSKFM